MQSLQGMKADLEAFKGLPLDLLPNEIIANIVGKMIPFSTGDDDRLTYYNSINYAVNFLSTSHRYAEFEKDVSDAIKRKYTNRYVSRLLLPFSIKKHNFKVSKILLSAAGGVLDFHNFIMMQASYFLEENRRSLRLYAQLLKLLQKNNQLIDDNIRGKNCIAFETKVNKSYIYHLGKAPWPKGYSAIPIKSFLDAVKDNEKVISFILSGETSTCSNELINAVQTNEPKIVKIILRAISDYPELTKKLLDDQDVRNFSTNSLMRAINGGNKK